MELIHLPQNRTVKDSPSLFKPGIFKVCLEKEVVRTYSNGLSFKHIPGTERRTYQLAVATRIQELGIESYNQCYNYAPFIMNFFERYKVLEERFDTTSQQEKFDLVPEIKGILEELEINTSRLQGQTLFQVFTKIICSNEPKYLAAKFAKLCNNRSNLGQSSFLRLVGTGRGYIEAVEKVVWLLHHFQSEPAEFISFLLFGRAPWTERCLTWRFKVPFSWARNFLVGLSNKFRFSLDKKQFKIPDVLKFTISEIMRAIDALEHDLQEKIVKMEKKDSNTSYVKLFLKSLRTLRKTPQLLIDYFCSKDYSLKWKSLKLYANNIKPISFSVLRAVIVRACLHRKEWEHAIKRCICEFTAKNTLNRPFHSRVSLNPLPIDLIMGSKYVIRRPGNAKKLQELLIKDGFIWFEFPNMKIHDKREKGIACWFAPKKVITNLINGAKLRMFRFNMPQGPGKTIKVDIVLSGKEDLFIGKKHLNSFFINKHGNKSIKKRSILGLDVNRLSNYTLTSTINLDFDEVIDENLKNWQLLEGIIAKLQMKLYKNNNWKNTLKLKNEIYLLNRRRSHLRKEIFTKFWVQLGCKLAELDVDYVGLEGNLIRDTKDKRGGLAKAISSMPNHIELVAKELLAINLTLDKNIKLVLVRKEGTSKIHSICGHVLERKGDKGRCSVCDMVVDMHKNSADNIENRVRKIIEQYNMITDLVGHLPPIISRGRNFRDNQSRMNV
ncbi:MAG: zinc ribbon domain-containing protein [Promethearchaeota archaeon]